jgi:hypothetical protein
MSLRSSTETIADGRISFKLLEAAPQDLPNAIKPQELGNRLRLILITNRPWQVQETCTTTGDGLYVGLDWLGEQINRPILNGIVTFSNLHKN